MDNNQGIEKKEQENQEKQQKQKKSSSIGGKLILVLGVGMIIFAAYHLISIFMDYHKSNALYDDLNKEFVDTPPENDNDGVTPEIPWYELATVELDKVKEQNKDVVGWIYFENEDISYPILFSGDDEKYLRTTLDGSYATAGSIFLEGQNSTDFSDSHTIIYGHNMKNLSMFGKLKYYKDDGYYEDHSYFQIITEGIKYRYQIFAYSDVEADSNVFSVPFAENQSFETFLDQLYKDSYKNTGVKATSADKVVTLSTCSSDDKRFVVHAVRTEEYSKDQNLADE